MKHFKNILVSTDVRFDNHPSVTEAAKVALQSGARLTLVDVFPKLSFIARVTVADHEHLNELLLAEKTKKLEELAQPMRDQGIEVATCAYQGKTSTEIVRHVLREKTDLVMRTTKARSSGESGFFGRTSTQLLRQCPCPVWLMQPQQSFDYKQILACVDSTTDDPIEECLNDLICKLATEIGSYHDTRYAIAHAWTIWNIHMLKSRMPENDFEEMVSETEKHERQMFEKFLERHDGSMQDDNVFLLKGEPYSAIPALVKKQQVDLLVLGTVGRSGLYGTIMGNTAERILQRVECDVLAVKPAGFQCSIKQESS